MRSNDVVLKVPELFVLGLDHKRLVLVLLGNEHDVGLINLLGLLSSGDLISIGEVSQVCIHLFLPVLELGTG